MNLQMLTPLKTFTLDQDKKLDHYNDYLISALNFDQPTALKALIQEIKFRFKTKMNFVFSTHGDQGTGKSFFTLALNILIGRVYNVPFKLENCVFNPFEYEKILSEVPDKTTTMCDEQTNLNAGDLSKYISSKLTEYEEQYRMKQINISFVAPRLYGHQHFLYFKTFNMVRDSKTLYPKTVFSILYMKDMKTEEFRPRMLIGLPVPKKKFITEYNILKSEHLDRTSSRKQGFSLEEAFLKDYDSLKKHYGSFEDFFTTNSKGNKKIVSVEQIKFLLYESLGTAHYTKDVYKIFIARLRKELTNEM